MQKVKYNQEQINELKTIKYVRNVTQKHIVFTTECKLKVIELSKKGIFSKEIFKKLGFPDYVINSEIPKNSVKRWKKNKLKGEIESKKGRPKVKKIDFDNMTKDEELEYLRAKVAYLEEIKKYIESGLP